MGSGLAAFYEGLSTGFSVLLSGLAYLFGLLHSCVTSAIAAITSLPSLLPSSSSAFSSIGAGLNDGFSALVSYLFLGLDYILGCLVAALHLCWTGLQIGWSYLVAGLFAIWEWLCGSAALVGAKGVDGVAIVGDSVGTGVAFLVETALAGARGLGALFLKGVGSLYDLFLLLGTMIEWIYA